MHNVAATSNKRSMKNHQNPATAHHTIMTARRPDNIRSSIMVRGRSIRSMARSCRRLRRPLPRKDSHFCHFGGLFVSLTPKYFPENLRVFFCHFFLDSNFAISRVSSAALLTSLILVNRETLLQARLLPVVLSAATFSMALVKVQSGGVTILAGF